jgi:hypothetical protein
MRKEVTSVKARLIYLAVLALPLLAGGAGKWTGMSQGGL